MPRPTVIAAAPFCEKTDAERLYNTLKGIFGCNDEELINVFCKRTNFQRLKIAQTYKTMYGEELVDKVKSKTSGNFQKVMVALLTSLDEYYAQLLHDAIDGLGTDEEGLIEILCTSPNQAIKAIRQIYQKKFGPTLEEDIKGDTSGNFRRLLVSMCTANRDESGQTNRQKAREDAQALYNAGEKKFGTDESMFNKVLCERNHAQLKLIFDEYKVISDKSIEDAIKSEFSGDIKDGLLAIVHCVRNRYEYFAKCLHKSMKGLGTNDKQLIRIIVMRAEIDMKEIIEEFQRLHGESLKEWIEGDTSGSYKKALWALIGEY